MADFSLQIAEILDNYETKTMEQLRSVVNSVTADAVSELHSAYPRGSAYNAGWTSKAKTGNNMYQRTIYGKKPTYRLAHLLENGHATRNGGRVSGTVHIKPIEESTVAALVERLKASL